MNLPTIDRNTLYSSDDYEQRVIDLFDHHMLRHVVDFPTCANNTIELVFQKKCNIFSERNDNFTKFFNIARHHAVKMRLECSHHQQKPIFEQYRSYRRAEYQNVIDIMSIRPFSPICHTNIDNMFSELCQYTETLIQECAPLRRDIDKKCLLGELKTQKIVLLERPTAYRRNNVSKLESVVLGNCEIDRLNYQKEKNFSAHAKPKKTSST